MHTDATRRRAGATVTTESSDINGTIVAASNSIKNNSRRRRAPLSAKTDFASRVYPILGIVGIGLLLLSRVNNGDHEHPEVPRFGAKLAYKMRRVNPSFGKMAQREETGDRPRQVLPRRDFKQSQAKPQKHLYVGDRSPRFLEIQKQFQQIFPDDSSANQRRLEWVKKLRKRTYYPISATEFDNVRDCPEFPPDGYPKAWQTMDIINNWGTDDTTPHEAVYQGICVFDFNKPGDIQKAKNYREAELPFVIRDDPDVLKTVERWNHPDYLARVLAGEEHRTEYSENNHFMYWTNAGGKTKMAARNEGWKPPTEMIQMTYDEWLAKANVTDDMLGADNPHWYFRLIGCGEFRNCDKFMSEWLFDDLTFFYPRESLYIVKPKDQKGIHCRFGMKGVIAENHFDASRNMIALLGGERRYILSHPDECPNLALLPKEHPSGRHSAVDWSNPDLEHYPQFRNARSNEIVLQPGDVLYLPTNW